MRRADFYDSVRQMFGGTLSAVQVQVMDAIFDKCEGMKVQHVAYIIATGFGEARMTPVRENMNYSVKRISQVWPSRKNAVQYAGKPKQLANEVYGTRLGNKPGTDDGWRFRGGGVDQLTGRANYAKIGIEHNPEAILKPEFSAWSLVHGMTTGRYTGKKLSDFDIETGFDVMGARAIVNSDGDLNGAKYAGYAAQFMVALNGAGWGNVNETPRPKNDASDVLKETGFLTALIKAIIGIFRGRA